MLGSFAQYVRTTYSNLNPTRVSSGAVSSARGVKQLVTDGVATLTILDPGVFAASLGPIQYFDSLRSDWRVGMNRVIRQEDAIDGLLAYSKSPPAWLLTTCYYGAFFAAVELLRIAGYFLSYFNTDDIAAITRNAPPSHFTLQPGPFVGVAQADPSSGIVVIRYGQNNTPTHALAWITLARVARAALVGSVDSNLLAFCQVLGMLPKTRWPMPNETRNEWNYSNARRYESRGGEAGKLLWSLAADRAAVYRWARRPRLDPNEQNCAAAVALARAALIDVMRELTRLL